MASFMKNLGSLITTCVVLAAFSACGTQSYGSKPVVLTKYECSILPLTTENYLNSSGLTLIYRGSALKDCSVSFNTYHVQGDGICFNPLSWDVTSCTVSVTLLFNKNFFPVPEHTAEEDREEWNCTTVPQMVCSNNSWARIMVTANQTTSDNFQIKAYVYGQKKFHVGYNSTDTDNDDDDDSNVHTYAVVAILVVALIASVVVMAIAIVIRKRRNREYSTAESAVE